MMSSQSSQGVGITPLQQMVSSCSGAIITSFTMTPLDVVKIRLQAQAKPSAFTKGHCFLYCNGLMDHLCSCLNGISPSSDWYKRPSQFNGSFDAMIKIARNEGITSLWSGLPPTLLMAVPATVVYFTSYDQLKTLYGHVDGKYDLSDQLRVMAAGSTARVFASSLISPIEMVRTKVQSESYTYSQVWKAVMDSIRVNGLLSLWRGLGPTLLRDIPFSALYWAGYETLKSAFLVSQKKEKLSFHETFAAGVLSGGTAGIITLPFDVIKTRRQIELGELEMMGKQGSSSTFHLIHKIFVEEGFRALFSGILPRVVKVAPSCAIMISTYEFFKNFFKSRKEISASEHTRPSWCDQKPQLVTENVPLSQQLVQSPSSDSLSESQVK